MGVVVGAIALRLATFLRSARLNSPTVSDFHTAFILVGVMGLVSIIDFVGLDHAAGAVVSGHQKS